MNNMRANYLLGVPTFLMIIGLAWASQTHAGWMSRDDDDGELPEVDSLTSQAERSSFDLGANSEKPGNNLLELFQKFDSMQHEVQELRGRIEEQDYQIQLLRKSQQAQVSQAVKTASPASSSGFSFTPSPSSSPSPKNTDKNN